MVIEGPGRWAWVYEDEVIARTGLNAVVGPHVGDRGRGTSRRRSPTCAPVATTPRRGWRDMDISGVWAQVNFPSGSWASPTPRSPAPRTPSWAWPSPGPGTTGCSRSGTTPFPERIVPTGVTFLADPGRGRRARCAATPSGASWPCRFPESPHHAGFPSLHTTFWDPILAACEDTGTVVCLHVGSGGCAAGAARRRARHRDGGGAVPGALDGGHHRLAVVGVPGGFPRLQLAMSEGGIGWVPLLVDRLTYMETHSNRGGAPKWYDELTPVERLRENFWFCMLDDPSALRNLDVVGEDRVMVETDYPHSDSTWPDSQEVLRARLEDPASPSPSSRSARSPTRNAATLFRHPLPPNPKPERGAPGRSRGCASSRCRCSPTCPRPPRCWPTGAPTSSRSSTPTTATPCATCGRRRWLASTSSVSTDLVHLRGLSTGASAPWPSTSPPRWPRPRSCGSSTAPTCSSPTSSPRPAPSSASTSTTSWAGNPSIIYGRGSGQGPTGPDAEKAGFDAVSFWARSGIAAAVTPVESPVPAPLPGAGVRRRARRRRPRRRRVRGARPSGPAPAAASSSTDRCSPSACGPCSPRSPPPGSTASTTSA